MSHSDELEQLARIAVQSGYELHRDLGPGLLESAYETLLTSELRRRSIRVERQVSIPLRYKGVVVDNAFKIDLLIEGKLVVN